MGIASVVIEQQYCNKNIKSESNTGTHMWRICNYFEGHYFFRNTESSEL